LGRGGTLTLELILTPPITLFLASGLFTGRRLALA
jgi:hypothetical protein